MAPSGAEWRSALAWSGHTRDVGEIVRTNNVAAISAVEGLLSAAGIPCFVADRDMSVIDGLISAIQMRVLVSDEREQEARELLADSDLAEWLR
jgi:hypothetical protein